MIALDSPEQYGRINGNARLFGQLAPQAIDQALTTAVTGSGYLFGCGTHLRRTGPDGQWATALIISVWPIVDHAASCYLT